MIYNVNAWFDDYDFSTMFLWDDASFYVHIKSQSHHEVYEIYGEKKLAYALKLAYKV